MAENVKPLNYPLDKVKTVVTKWLRLRDTTVVDVVIATHIANKFPMDPLWTLIIGAPSSAKTEILRSLDGHPDAYFLSTLTPTALVSGMVIKGQDPSLLLRLDGKTLVLKDFTSVLSMRSENQQEILGQLREIFDGKYNKAFGNGKVVDWHGHVGLLGACTSVYDKHYAVIGTLGDRFLLYRTENVSGEEMGLQAQRIVGKEQEMREEMRAAVHQFINQFDDIDGVHFEQDAITNMQIVQLATFCAHGRCPVDRNRIDRSVEYEPSPEGTARLVKQFMQLGYGLALIHGKNRIDGEIYEIIKKVGRDLLSRGRLNVIKHLWNEGYWQKSREIAEGINMPTNTAKNLCEDLMITGLLNRTRNEGKSETLPYEWRLNQYCQDLISGGAVFNVTTNEPF